MIDLYYWTTQNGHKITLFLEEAGLPYTIHPVDLNRGDQFKPEFVKISPNNRIPAIVDNSPADGRAPISVFESGAILLYLAEKTQKFSRESFWYDLTELRFRQCGGLWGHVMQLTEDGANVKTALVGSFGAVFRGKRGQGSSLRHQSRLQLNFRKNHRL
jgi:glutathione S-transferase